ncbi:MAG: hypothetical protein JXR52_01735 [Bacteroidales bacterium]|nr:hypothetical protein [Bacteroidales bacterium]
MAIAGTISSAKDSVVMTDPEKKDKKEPEKSEARTEKDCTKAEKKTCAEDCSEKKSCIKECDEKK